MGDGPERRAYGPNLAPRGSVTVSPEPAGVRAGVLNDGVLPFGQRFDPDHGPVPLGACVWTEGPVRVQLDWPCAHAVDEVVVRMPILVARPDPQRTIAALTVEYRDCVTLRWVPVRTTNGQVNPALDWVVPAAADGSEVRAFEFETVTTDAIRVGIELGGAGGRAHLGEIEVYERREPAPPFALRPLPGPGADTVLEPGDACRVAVQVTDAAGLAIAHHPVTFGAARILTDRAGRAAARIETGPEAGPSMHSAVSGSSTIELAVRTQSRAEALATALAWLEHAAGALQEGCRMVAFDGTVMYTPDGIGSYAGFWVRDFHYMVEGNPAGIPAEHVRSGFEYLIARQRADGAMPNKVRADGVPVYCPGAGCDGVFGPLPPPDNPPFMVKLAHHHRRLTGDLSLFADHAEQLARGMEFVPRSPSTGLAHIPPEHPSSPYGFTDAIAKTGDQLFDSLLYHEAAGQLAELFAELGDRRAARRWTERASQVRGGLQTLYDPGSGMFLAASVDCRQIDIWGSAYAACIGAISDGQRRAVAVYLRDNYDGVVSRGQVRHTAPGERWQRTIVPHVDVYQNGPYWALASGWVASTIATVDRGLAERMLLDLVADFQANGINEAVDPESGYVAIPSYVVSATNPIPALAGLERAAASRAERRAG